MTGRGDHPQGGCHLQADSLAIRLRHLRRRQFARGGMELRQSVPSPIGLVLGHFGHQAELGGTGHHVTVAAYTQHVPFATVRTARVNITSLFLPPPS